MTPKKDPAPGREQTYGELQALLREEIRLLQDQLQTSLAEIARLTAQLDAVMAKEAEAAHPTATPPRHDTVAQALARAAAQGWNEVPAANLPPIARQIEMLQESGLFDAAWYLGRYPDLAGTGIPPEEHYVRAGAYEGRDPGPGFQSMAYYLANPDVAEHGWPALVHYAAFGKAEGRALAWNGPAQS